MNITHKNNILFLKEAKEKKENPQKPHTTK